jgi:two-component system, CitB family, sensor kinase
MRRRGSVRPLTLSGQFLALQLTIIVVVLVAVTGVSLAQADITFRQAEGQRMRAIAETGASTETVRVGLIDPAQQGILPPTAEYLRTLSGADHIIIAGTDLRILTSPNPGDIDAALDIAHSTVLSGRAWTGRTTLAGNRFVTAHVPVISNGQIIGLVAAGRQYPGLGERLLNAAPTLVVYLGIAAVLGIAGSLLLARRVKRQTLGLEPIEITGLVEHREAMLHGIREGVISLDTDNRVTLVNDTAVELLRLPPDTTGRRLEELDIEPGLYSALTEASSTGDRVVVMGGHIVTLNRMPLIANGRHRGSVTTMRDRTDLLALRNELDVTRTATEALRAQAHEFSNQLHVISGLLELDERDEARHYVQRISGAHTQLSADISTRLADPSIAALLIAKASLANELGAQLRVSDRSRLEPVDEELAADLVTVAGNLVDNALDAVRGIAGASGPAVVEAEITEDADDVRLTVRDSGPGVPPQLNEQIFCRGFSTKDDEHGGHRGFGLAIIDLICARRGGTVTVTKIGAGAPGDGNSGDIAWGAEFTVTLPRRPGRSVAARASGAAKLEER